MICFNWSSIILFSLTLVIIALVAIGITTNYILNAKNTIVNVQTPTVQRRNTDFPEREFVQSNNVGTNVGYVFLGNLRYPLYQQRENQDYYYHVQDDSRVGIKIPISRKYLRDQLYDNDTVSIPELGGDFTVKLYDISRLTYHNFFN